jgi:hypothetical protein
MTYEWRRGSPISTEAEYEWRRGSPYVLWEAPSGGETHSGAASFSGAGAATAVGRRFCNGVAALAGSGALTAVAQRIRSGASALAGSGALTAVGQLIRSGVAVVAAEGTLTAAGLILPDAIESSRTCWRLWFGPPGEEGKLQVTDLVTLLAGTYPVKIRKTMGSYFRYSHAAGYDAAHNRVYISQRTGLSNARYRLIRMNPDDLDDYTYCDGAVDACWGECLCITGGQVYVGHTDANDTSRTLLDVFNTADTTPSLVATHDLGSYGNAQAIDTDGTNLFIGTGLRRVLRCPISSLPAYSHITAALGAGYGQAHVLRYDAQGDKVFVGLGSVDNVYRLAAADLTVEASQSLGSGAWITDDMAVVADYIYAGLEEGGAGRIAKISKTDLSSFTLLTVCNSTKHMCNACVEAPDGDYVWALFCVSATDTLPGEMVRVKVSDNSTQRFWMPEACPQELAFVGSENKFLVTTYTDPMKVVRFENLVITEPVLFTKPRSYWYPIRFFTELAFSAADLKAYSDGENNLGTDVDLMGNTASAYTEPTGTPGDGGDELNPANYPTLAAAVEDAFGWTSGSPKAIPGSGAAAGDIGDFLVLQMLFGESAVMTETPTEDLAFLYDDYGREQTKTATLKGNVVGVLEPDALVGAGMATMVGALVLTAAAVLSGSGTASASSSVVRPAAAALSASGAATAASGVTRPASSVLSGAGAANATGVRTMQAGSAPAGAGAVSVVGLITRNVAAVISAQGTVAAAGYITRPGAGAFAGAGTITATCQLRAAGRAALAGAGALTAAGNVVGAQVSLVGTSTMVSGTRTPPQRKAFYAAGRFWAFYYNNGNIVCRTSTDGSTWSSETVIRAGDLGANLSVCFDGTYVHYACARSAVWIYYRRGTPNSDGSITWSAAEQTITETVACQDPSMAVDSNGYPWIAYHYGGTNDKRWRVRKSSKKDGTWATEHTWDLYTDTSIEPFGALVALTDGKMYSVYYGMAADEHVRGQLCTADVWGDEEIASASHIDDGDYSPLSATAIGDDVHLVFLEAITLDVTYAKRTSGVGWGAEETVDSAGVAQSAPAISYDVETDDIYCFWSCDPTAAHVYYRQRTGAGWEASVDWIDESADGWGSRATLTCYPVALNGYVGVLYTTKAASPFNVKHSYLDLPQLFAGGAGLAGAGAISAAGLVTRNAAVAPSGSGSVSVAGLVMRNAAATQSGTGTLIVSSSVTKSASAVLAGGGGVSASGVRTRLAAGALSGSGSVSASAGRMAWAGGATLSGSGAVDAQAETGTERLGRADLSGTSVLVAVGAQVHKAVASLGGAGSVTAVAQALRATGAGLAGVGSLVPAGHVTRPCGATLSGSGAVSVGGVAIRPGAAVVGGSGTIAASGAQLLRGIVSLAAAGNLTASSEGLPAGRAVLDGAGMLSAAGLRTRAGAAALAGDGSLAAAGVIAVTLGEAALSGQGALTASGHRTRAGSAAVDGAGTLAPAGVCTRCGAAAMAGAGAVEVRAETGTERLGRADVAGNGALSAAAVVRACGQVAVAGQGALGALGSVARLGQSALTGAGALTASSAGLPAGKAVLEGDGSLSVSAGVTVVGTGQATGSGSLSASGIITRSAVCGLQGAGALLVSAGVQLSAAAAPAGVGTLAAAGVRTRPGAAAIGGAGLLDVRGETGGERLGRADIAGSGSLLASAHVSGVGSAALAGAGAASVSGVRVYRAGSAVSGTGTVIVAALRIRAAVVAVSGAGVLVATGLVLEMERAAAALAAEGALAASSEVVHRASATLGAAGNLTASPEGFPVGRAVFEGSGALAVSAGRLVIGSAALPGSGLLAANGVLLKIAVVALAGNGVVIVVCEATLVGVVALMGESDLSAMAISGGPREAAAALSGQSELTVSIGSVVAFADIVGIARPYADIVGVTH